MNIKYYYFIDKFNKKEFEEILKILQNWADNYDMAWSPLKTQRLVFAYPSGPKVEHAPLEMYFGGKKIEPFTNLF